MKTRNYISAVLFVLFGSIAFTGCIVDNRDDHYNPPPPAGYQFIFNEDFNNNLRGWEFDDPQDSAYAFIDNGFYNFIDYSYNMGTHTAVVPVGLNPDNDFLAQTRLRSDNAMAMIFGASNNDYGYSLWVDNVNGEFALYYEGSTHNNIQTILNWQSSSAIGTGYNDVEVEQVGNYWYGYINNVKVFSIPSRYLAGDQFGFMVLPGTNGKADYLTVKY